MRTIVFAVLIWLLTPSVSHAACYIFERGNMLVLSEKSPAGMSVPNTVTRVPTHWCGRRGKPRG